MSGPYFLIPEDELELVPDDEIIATYTRDQIQSLYDKHVAAHPELAHDGDSQLTRIYLRLFAD